MPESLNANDLHSAVAAGVINAEQAAKLRAMQAADRATPLTGPDGEPAIGDEERFRFLNGFNDVFLTIGVLLVAGAFIFAAAPSFSGSGWLAVMAFAAATFWILSELLVGRLRAVLPGMALAILFSVFTAAAFIIGYYRAQSLDVGPELLSELSFWRNPTLMFAAPALIAALVYYWRFRLPFSLALIACLGYVAIYKLLELAMGPTSSSAVGFVYGLAVLGVALAYDARDRKRVTRLSDCAFWLHLVAAPLIVSPVINSVKAAAGGPTTSLFVLATVLALGLFALAIDRRALLVSSLIYFTIAVYDVFGGGIGLPSRGAVPTSFVMTLAFVGAFVLVLGVFWHPLRNRLLPWLVPGRLAAYVPPARP